MINTKVLTFSLMNLVEATGVLTSACRNRMDRIITIAAPAILDPAASTKPMIVFPPLCNLAYFWKMA